MYKGIRGDKFIDLLRKTLLRGKLKDGYINILMNKHKLYDQVFTHLSYDAKKNYEWFEFIGDGTVNKCIMWYLSRRFPNLMCKEGVQILTRLKINLVSRQNFSIIAENLGFWNYISASEIIRQTQKKYLLEDVFESFMGATEYIIDENVHLGAGYIVCYNIIENIFNEIDISLKYEHLYDSKTRLKELFDKYKVELGILKYVSTKKTGVHSVIIYRKIGGKWRFLAKSTSSTLLKYAEQDAAQKAIDKLNLKGYKNKLPEIYSTLLTDWVN